jgi:hypothetical protein
MRVILDLEDDQGDSLVIDKLLEDLQFVTEETYGEHRVQLIASFLDVISWYTDPETFAQLAGAFAESCLTNLPDSDPLFKYLYSEWKQ